MPGTPRRWFVYIGRFQPFHKGHLSILEWAHSQADGVVVVVGSDNLTPTAKNPWTATQRAVWIAQALEPHQLARTRFVSVRDYPGQDDLWRADIMAKVYAVTPRGSEIVVTGYRKDSSTYYLSTFTEWLSQFRETSDGTSASDVRKAYFSKGPRSKWAAALPQNVAASLDRFRQTRLFSSLAEDLKGGG